MVAKTTRKPTLLEEVTRKNPNIMLGKCEKCGSDSSQIAGSPVVLLQSSGGAISTRTGISFFTKSCRQCGFAEFYSLDALEIDWKNL